MQPDQNCLNCHHNFSGVFCPLCGQNVHEHRINAAYFLHDIPHSVFHIDKGLWYTFIQLMKRPGPASKEYLAGKRINHYRPFAYVIILSAFTSLVIHWIRKLIQYSYFRQTGQTLDWGEGFFTKYQSLFIFLMIPVVSLCTWLVFKKSRYNYWEHMLVNTYMAAQLNVLLIIMYIFSLCKFLVMRNPSFNLTIFITGFMFYYAFTFSRLIRGEGISGLQLGIRLGLMCFFLALVYATGMSFAGIMTPWWGLR